MITYIFWSSHLDCHRSNEFVCYFYVRYWRKKLYLAKLFSKKPELIQKLGQSDFYDNADGTYCQQQLNLQYKLVTD